MNTKGHYPPRYLGDGVYVEIVDGELILTTHDGQGETNQIVLVLETRANLRCYLRDFAGDKP